MFRDFLDDIDNYSSDPEIFLNVPFVPTEEAVVEAMLDLAGVGPKDALFDLGSGDGRIVIAAARDRGARGVGVEIDPRRIADAMEEAGSAGVERFVDFIEEDIFDVDFSEATVVTLYLLESVNTALRPRLLSELRPGARIVSHAFGMGDWKADDWLRLGDASLYKWIAPARVAGVWEWERADGARCRVDLRQKYQEVSGTAELAGKEARLESARLCGGRLEVSLRRDEAAPPDRFTLNFGDTGLRSVEEAPASGFMGEKPDRRPT